MSVSRKLHLPTALLAAFAAVACVADEGDDELQANQLDRLRVLGIASEPPDLIPGERATLSAVVFAPGDQDVTYEWSWCPVRAGATEGFACAFEESVFVEVWQQVSGGQPPPPYDLGTAPEAFVDNVFDPASRLCEALTADGRASGAAEVGCLDGLELSVRLRISAGGSEEVALKSVPLLPAFVPAEQRNHNPGPLGSISVSGATPSQPAGVRTGTTVGLSVDVSEALSESVIEATPDGEPVQVRREALVLSWFVAPGKTLNYSDSDFGAISSATDRTLFVPGVTGLEQFTTNGWELPESDRETARLVIVLRDDRGGLAWREETYALTEMGQ